MPAMMERIGSFTIQRELGRGGMGVVYLATDTRLDRQVAIKALPSELASDPVRLERFEREAKTLASLNHPNLAGIHGVEEQDGAKYLVLEFVEGETLADRLDRGPLPVDEAIELAVQIAAGVEAAHEAGVIHRDLKPANIIVTPDGDAKVLDFGLARTDEGGQSSTGALDSPTMTSPQPQHSPTIAGAILGTAAYMSPEQARGRRVDKRTDIWSFGVVLYEMLVGSSPFHGETATDSIGAVLHKDLDLHRLPSETPANVRRVLDRCLVRDRNLRYRDIGDVRVELLTQPTDAASHTVEPGQSRGWIAIAALLAVTCVGLGIAMWLRPTPEAPEQTQSPARLTFPVTLIPDGEFLTGDSPDFALSPDGTRLVVSATVGSERGLWLRELASDAALLLPGTADAETPVFSPDGAWIAYFTDTALWKIATAGGSPQRLADATASNRGVAWLGNDRLVYSPNTTAVLHMVTASGGTPETITSYDSFESDRPHRSHRWPASTPDGRGVVFTAQSGGDSFNESSIAVVDLDSGQATTLLERAGTFPIVLPGGELLYTSGGTVYACLVDWSVPALVGTPKPILYDVVHWALNGGVQLAVAGDGTALYIRGSQGGNSLGMPTWIDLATGERTPLLDEPTSAVTPRISPDGSRVTFGSGLDSLSTGSGSSAGLLVIYELARGVRTEITLPRVATNPIWSPDGREIAFSMSTEESAEIPHIVSIDGESPPRPLVDASLFEQFTTDWSPDGSRILITQWSSDADWQLYTLQRDGEDWVSSPMLTTPAVEAAGVVSPDEAWIAYFSNITGNGQLFIRRLDGPPDRRQISIDGGSGHQWAPDGRSLYYFKRDKDALGWTGQLMQVDLTEVNGRLEPSAPRPLHEMEHVGATGGRGLQHLHPDGTRMLYIAPVGETQPTTDANQTYLRTGLIDDIRRQLGETP